VAKKKTKPRKKEAKPAAPKPQPTQRGSVSFGFDDIVKLMSENKNPQEQVLVEAFKQLFSKDNLLLMSRLTNDLSEYLLKLILIRIFYGEMWGSSKAHGKLVFTDKPPYYKAHWDIEQRSKLELSRKAWIELEQSVESVSVSYAGQGRAEVMGVFRAIDQRLQQQELAEQKGGMIQRVLS
jgi:hypothetical protein